MSTSSPGTGISNAMEEIEKLYKYNYKHSINNVTLPYTVPYDGAVIATLSTTETKYSGVDFFIDGISIFSIGALSANSSMSQRMIFHVKKGAVISAVVNDVGGSINVKYLYD